jgi:L-fucose isomerase-like protein
MENQMSNMPKVKIEIVAVSRDCFPESLSVNRRKNLMKAYTEKYGTEGIYECPICIVESEIHMVQALEDIKKAGCNALCVYLGNFGPEISETLLAKHFDGPKMFVAAAEESGDNLLDGRGDAYCGMLNASYNLKLRGMKAYIPEYPVGNAEECAEMLHEFVPIARAVVGLSSLKIISFGPRPLNFLACNAPIQQLYNLGVEIEKNFPHHGAVAFGNFGKTLYEVFKYVGVPVEEIGYNQPAGVRYPTENPWG